MADKGVMSPAEAVDEYFDMLIKSRFIEMFEGQGYQSIRLGDLLNQNMVVTRVDDPENESFVTLSSGGRGARRREIKDGKVPVAFSGYRIHTGQFIYSRIDARNAAFDIVSISLDGAVVSKDFPVFDINTGIIEPVFLLHSVLQDSFVRQIQNSSFGATNRQRIKEEVMMEYTIVLPPLSKQKEYCCFVQLVHSIKIRYQKLITSFDNLIKSRFIEMFGKNQYDEKPLGELFKTSSGGTPLKGRNDYYNEGTIPWLTSGEVNNERITEAKTKITDLALHETSAKIPPLNSVLVSMYGSIGYAGILEFKAAINQAICAIHPNSNFTPEWICFFIRSKKDELVNQGVGAALTNISQEKIRKLNVPLVPMSQQEEFTAFVHQVDKSKFEVVRSLTKLLESVEVPE